MSNFNCSGEMPPVMIADQRSSEFAILSFEKKWQAPTAKLWGFSPKELPELELPCSSDAAGRECYQLWGAPSDVKCVLNRSHLLCIDSLGGVMLVRMADKKIIWHVYPRNNPHSAELLPDGNVVTASSEGNYLRLYNIAKFDPADPGAPPYQQFFADDVHGVVWDKTRQCLWSSGMFGVCEWKYLPDPEKPGLEFIAQHTLVLDGGIFHDRIQRLHCHDLFPGPDGKLFVTARDAIYLFDPENRRIESFMERSSVKSCDIARGKVMMLVPQERWWAEAPVFPEDAAAGERCTIPYAKIYKTRYFQDNKFSY